MSILFTRFLYSFFFKYFEFYSVDFLNAFLMLINNAKCIHCTGCFIIFWSLFSYPKTYLFHLSPFVTSCLELSYTLYAGIKGTIFYTFQLFFLCINGIYYHVPPLTRKIFCFSNLIYCYVQLFSSVFSFAHLHFIL